MIPRYCKNLGIFFIGFKEGRMGGGEVGEITLYSHWQYYVISQM